MQRDLMPDDNKINDSLEKDYLGRNYYLNNLVKMLTSISLHTVMSIDGKWGSGKTFFIKQFEYLVKHPNNFSNIQKETIEDFNKEYSFFYFNAWENDYLPPLESLILQLKNSLWDSYEEISDKALGFIKGITNFPVQFLSGGSVNLDDFKDTYMSSYVKKAELLSKSSEEINNLLYNYELKTKKKILFVIDDLDRCKPTYAVELLETIKHNFNSDSAIFVICVNNEQLQHTIKKILWRKL